MGFFDKFRPNNADDDYDNFEDDFDNEFGAESDYQEDAGYNQNAQPQSRPQGRGMGLNSGALEMKVVKPDKYDSATAQKIADHLLSKRTVVLNLEETNKESARRLIDFLSGVAYSISGYIQRVATNTFIIVPENVDISGEQLQEVRKQEEADLY